MDRTLASDLNKLIRLAKDGEKGYKEAAARLDNPTYREVFMKYGQERKQFAEALQGFVMAEDMEPAETGTLQATAYRTMVRMLVEMADDEDGVILTAIENAVDDAVKTYHDVLENSLALSPPVRDVVEQQYAAYQETQKTIKELLDKHYLS